MMEEAPLTNAVAGNEITATACDVAADEDKGATSMNLTSSLEQQRQWFLHLSPEERAAVLGFVDGRMVTVLAKAVASSLPTSGLEPAVVVGASDDAVNNGAVKQEALGTERMTGRRCVSDGHGFDWEAMIPLNVVEKFWHEVGEVDDPKAACSPNDDDDKSVIAEATVTEVVEEGTVVSIEGEAAKIDTMKSPDESNGDISQDTDNDSKQPDAFRIRNEVTEEEKEGHYIIPIITSSDSMDIASIVAINSDEPDGEVVEEGAGIMAGDDQTEQSTSTESVADATTTTTTNISVTTEAQIRATSEREESPQFLSISSSNGNCQNTFTTTINEVMGNICTIIPATFNLSNDAALDTYITSTFTTTGERTPSPRMSQALRHSFNTLHPFYLKSISGEDLLFTLDSIAAKGSMTTSRTFLDPNIHATSSWIERVRYFVTTEAGEAGLPLSETLPLPASTALSLPLYMLVFAGLQMSVFNSYQEYLNVDSPRDGLPALSEGIVNDAEQGMTQMSDADGGLVDVSAKLHPFMYVLKDIGNADSQILKNTLATVGSKCHEAMPTAGIDTNNCIKQSSEDYLIHPFSVVLLRISSNLADQKDDVGDSIPAINTGLTKVTRTEEVSVALNDDPSLASSDKGSHTTESTAVETLLIGNEVMNKIQLETTGIDNTEGAPSHSTIGTDAQSSKKSKKKKKKKKKRNAGSAAATVDSVETMQAASDENGNTDSDHRIDEVAAIGYTQGDKLEEVGSVVGILDEIGEVTDEKEGSDGKMEEAATTKEESVDSSVDNVGGTSLETSEANNDEPTVALKQEAAPKDHFIPALNPVTPSIKFEDHFIPALNPVTPSIKFETDTSTASSVDTEEDIEKEEVSDIPQEAEQRSGLHVCEDGTVSAVDAKSLNSNEALDVKKSEDLDTLSSTIDGQEDEWATVEAKPRGSRKKGTERGMHVRSFSQTGSFGGLHGANSKKKAPRSKETRNRIKARKLVKDVLSSVLDAVEDEVLRRRSASRERAKIHAIGTSQSVAPSSTGVVDLSNDAVISTHQNTATQEIKGMTMRDILVGSKGVAKQHGEQAPKNAAAFMATPAPRATAQTYSEKARLKSDHVRGEVRGAHRSNGKAYGKADTLSTRSPNKNGTQSADQNTIPTVPETLSAVSTNSAFTPSITNVTTRDPGVAQSTDSSTDESVEAQKAQSTPTRSSIEVSPSPPLPTLLSPGNNNSASSSVASSLDAPHAGHHGNLSHPSENDVGYHLLDVCDRLSGEISVFMKRREDALKARRQERGLVLEALGESLRTIWPGMCSVEMYGSCATNLDLPSSDLDVVVRGLDRPQATSHSKAEVDKGSNASDEKATQDKSLRKAISHQEFPSYTPDQQYPPHHLPSHHMQMMYGHMSLNAERVLRLAMELERQPWAVHVKAIPTASVPVIKILADPARLPGAAATGSGDWLMQHTMATQASSSMKGQILKRDSDSQSGKQPPLAHYPNGQAPPLWRGADVVNGLLKVDITFEGPEHGGIGSTLFSSRLIEDFSNETDLTPECTPQVQVLMVLKELLAQRRLNEPFSGGLSSYALLLLVISVIAERRIICEELEKVERQRMVVAAGGGNSVLRSPASVTTTNETFLPEKFQVKKDALPKPEDVRPNGTEQYNGNYKTRELVDVFGSKGEISKIHSQGRELSKSTNINAPKMTEQQSKTSETSAKRALGAKTSSWASIAKKSSSSGSFPRKASVDSTESNASEPSFATGIVPPQSKTLKKPSSFADAVSKGAPPIAAPALAAQPSSELIEAKKSEEKTKANKPKNNDANTAAKPLAPYLGKNVGGGTDGFKQSKSNLKESRPATVATERSIASTSLSSSNPHRINTPSSLNNPSTDAITSVDGPDSSLFPQGFHDVIEVLCSGEATSGKLLMHILLFYGQHFDSQSTAIDYSGTHHRDPSHGGNLGYSTRSPYLQRRTAGSYDPVTGMLTVDPIVVYDPLEGAENNNVARSCFAWSSIRWVFAQSYMTLSSAVETNASQGSGNRAASGEGPAYGHDESGHVVVDPSSPLLELLLSF